jgi:hypothetical protein
MGGFALRLTVLIGFMLLGISAHASPKLIVDTNGILRGATGVLVDGRFYDVEFLEGTCASVFGLCDQAHFTFTTESAALAASKALLDSVLLDGSGLGEAFDGIPALTYGCYFEFNCWITTPYGIANGFVLVAQALNNSAVPPAGQSPQADEYLLRGECCFPLSGLPQDTTYDSTVDINGTFARWTAVPEEHIPAVADSFLRQGAPNTNEGANPRLRIQDAGNNRALVAFDLTEVPLDRVTRATLVLTIAENADNWGRSNNRTVDAHPLLTDFIEGNGKAAGLPNSETARGSGSGVTWDCAVDANVANQKPDCSARWNGGDFGPATAAPVVHFNGLTGDVAWDVTADIQAGATGWLIKKTNEALSGQVSYYSKEGAEEAGNSALTPRLVVELDKADAQSPRLRSRDYAVTGDGLLTYDTVSKLEWLDLTVTRNLTGNEVLSGTGGWLTEGFRYPTADELTQLFIHAGLGTTSDVWLSELYEPARDFLQLIGAQRVNEPNGSALYSEAAGLYRNPLAYPGWGMSLGDVATIVGYQFPEGVDDRGYLQHRQDWYTGPDDRYPNIGHWLVRGPH